MENIKEDKQSTAVVVQQEKMAETTTEYMPSIDDLKKFNQTAQERLELMKQIETHALAQTNQHDWVDMQGKPYLQASGAEKVARFFGVSWKLSDRPTKDFSQDEKGSYYVYTCKGEFFFNGKSIEVFGTCSQRDKFFGRDKDSTTGFKEASAVDETNIIKKSVTNCIAKGVTTVLGIRNLTWERLNKAGIYQDKASKVTYAQGGAGGGKISQAQANRLYAIAKQNNVSSETMTKYLKTNFKIDNSKEINKTDYERICKWVEEQGKGSAIEPEEDNIEL